MIDIEQNSSVIYKTSIYFTYHWHSGGHWVWVGRVGSSHDQAQAAGIQEGMGHHPCWQGMVGALGGVPSVSVHPAHDCWHHASVAGSPYGRRVPLVPVKSLIWYSCLANKLTKGYLSTQLQCLWIWKLWTLPYIYSLFCAIFPPKPHPGVTFTVLSPRGVN